MSSLAHPRLYRSIGFNGAVLHVNQHQIWLTERPLHSILNLISLLSHLPAKDTDDMYTVKSQGPLYSCQAPCKGILVHYSLSTPNLVFALSIVCLLSLQSLWIVLILPSLITLPVLHGVSQLSGHKPCLPKPF